jgi:hypothetical protein
MASQPVLRRESGSAYVITLLALVVLTILALGLAFVTGTEVQVATNERNINRTFYAADAGIQVAAAQALVNGNYGPNLLILNKSTVGNTTVADRVDIAPMAPILLVRCDWCPANEDGPEFWRANHATTATAQRLAWNGSWDGADPIPAEAQLFGQKTISAMLEFQPWPTPPVESISDTEALKKIKF